MFRTGCNEIWSIKEFMVCGMKLPGGFYPVRTVVSSTKNMPEQLMEMPNLLFLQYADTLIAERVDAFNSELAERVANHLKDCPADIVFCCDAGESRSAALAAAHVRFRGHNDIRIWKSPRFHPNALIYKVMLEAWDIDISDDELESLREINEAVLAEQISFGNSWPHPNQV